MLESDVSETFLCIISITHELMPRDLNTPNDGGWLVMPQVGLRPAAESTL